MKLAALVVAAASAACATGAHADEELQKKLANPLADLVTVPMQYTGNFNTGPLDKTQHVLTSSPSIR